MDVQSVQEVGIPVAHSRMQAWLSGSIFALTTIIGVAAFLYPFWMPVVTNADLAHSGDSALMLTLLVIACFAVLLVEVQTHAISAKTIALLGVLVALNSILRFAEVAIPGPGGFTPIFPLIILGGYVFGARIGFLLGALTLLVSALITGGVGPWLPYQMLTAGWVGMSAPLARPLVALCVRAFSAVALPVRRERVEVALLAIGGTVWGLMYGAIINIWFWPFVRGNAQMYWEPGISLGETLQRYAVFYAVTSLGWDLLGAAGNAILIVLLGVGVLRILRRFQQRFDFTYSPAPVSAPPRSHQPATHPLEGSA